jgi:hypothetical protein
MVCTKTETQSTIKCGWKKSFKPNKHKFNRWYRKRQVVKLVTEITQFVAILFAVFNVFMKPIGWVLAVFVLAWVACE